MHPQARLGLAMREIHEALFTEAELDRIEEEPRWSVQRADELGVQPLPIEELQANAQKVLELGLEHWRSGFSEDEFDQLRRREFVALALHNRGVDWDHEYVNGWLPPSEINAIVKQVRAETRSAAPNRR